MGGSKKSNKLDILELSDSNSDHSEKYVDKKDKKNKKDKKKNSDAERGDARENKRDVKKHKKIKEEEIQSDTEYNEREYTDAEIEKANMRISKSVAEWIDCDDQIREYAKITKLLKQQKQAFEQKIIKIMKEYDVENTITLSDGKLIKNESKTKTALKEDLIETALIELIKNKERAQEITQYILNKRTVKVREYLKRTRIRKDKK